MSYEGTRARVETYFDSTATRTWERLTSDAPVSKIRQTVRAGRDAMRDTLLSDLPADMSGLRVLDAGCGPGQFTEVLAERGAEVFAIDISPSLIGIAEQRLPQRLRPRVAFAAGDMLATPQGQFDHIFAMDSLIYYDQDDVRIALDRLSSAHNPQTIRFTVAPKTTLLMAMWYAGKLFPRSDRSPTMIPHSATRLSRHLDGLGRVRDLGRVQSGFYISHAMELRP